MAKLVTKFKYLSGKRGADKYTRYIATREGVEKVSDSVRARKTTKKQDAFIKRLIKEFPKAKESLEYEDYRKNPTRGNASDFIERCIEDNCDHSLDDATYADYIATRPGAEKRGEHGLFSDVGKEVNLKQVSDELKGFDGNVWTVIISLRREDAKRLGFENASRWQTFLASHTDEIANYFNIPLSDLKWYAAFHNESHHPHVHMIVYSNNTSIRLTQHGINKLRSIFVNDVFQDEMYYLATKDTDSRNQLKKRSKEELDEIRKQIFDCPEDLSELQAMMTELSHMLNEIDRKVVYGNAPKRIRAKVNLIVEKMASNHVIASLYDEWYNARDEITSYYQTEKNRRVPLSANETFKSIRNDVLRCAYEISKISDHEQWDEDIVNIPRPDLPEERSPMPRKTVDQFIASQVAHLIAGLGQMIAEQTEINDGTNDMRRRVDRKLRRKINEKKQSQGMKM